MVLFVDSARRLTPYYASDSTAGRIRAVHEQHRSRRRERDGAVHAGGCGD